ncbi:MAG TPA: hypothetical protein VK395_22260 [Gemmataceae bacterium]|nr:hypothetical protein [Gemmataceae bacterium]
MARICPSCKLAFRAHDPGVDVQIPQGQENVQWVGFISPPAGGYQVCNDCLKIIAPERWQPLRMPERSIHTALSRMYCALCNNYAREDQDPGENGVLHAIRLTEEDVAGTGEKPGVRLCCHDCLLKWRPVVFERWQRELIVNPVGLLEDKQTGIWHLVHGGIHGQGKNKRAAVDDFVGLGGIMAWPAEETLGEYNLV